LASHAKHAGIIAWRQLKKLKTTTSKQTDMDLLHGKPCRRRHHHMAVIVEADLPQDAVQCRANASSPPAASGLNSAVPQRTLAKRAVIQAVGRCTAPFRFVVKYPPCLDNRAFRWRRSRPGMERGRPLGDAAWMARIVDRLTFGHTLRREGWFTHEKA